MKTFNALLLLEVKLLKRSLPNLIMGIGMPVFFFLFFSATIPEGLPKHTIASFMLSYMISMTAFSSISFAIFTFPFSLLDDRLGGRLRMTRFSPIPMWQYYAVKVLRIMLYYVLSIGIVFTVAHVFRGVNLPLGDWIGGAALLFFGVSSMMSLGLILSLSKTSESLSISGNVTYLGLAMLGGLFVPLETFPDWLQRIGKLTPTYQLHHLVASYMNHQFDFSAIAFLFGYAIIFIMIYFYIKRMESRR